MSLKVLIVDDSKSMRAVIKKTLSAAGFAVSECYEGANGLEALEVLEKESIDIVLSDINMPNMNGIEFLREKAGRDGI
jgi:two-component system chemotaxis response regulator CheY